MSKELALSKSAILGIQSDLTSRHQRELREKTVGFNDREVAFQQQVSGLRMHGISTCPKCHQKSLGMLSGWQGHIARAMIRCTNPQCNAQFDYARAYPNLKYEEYYFQIQVFETETQTLFHQAVYTERRNESNANLLEESKSATNEEGKDNKESDAERVWVEEGRTGLLCEPEQGNDKRDSQEEEFQKKVRQAFCEAPPLIAQHIKELTIKEFSSMSNAELLQRRFDIEDAQMRRARNKALLVMAIWILAVFAAFILAGCSHVTKLPEITVQSSAADKAKDLFKYNDIDPSGNGIIPDSEYRCIDALALTTDADCDNLEKTLTGTEMIGMFMEVDGFKPAINCVKRLVAKKKIAAFRAQGAWRDDHNFPSDNKSLDSYANLFNPLSDIAKQLPTFCSGACEHNLKAPAIKALRAKVLARVPECIYVNTPLPGRGDFIDGFNEAHGNYTVPRTLQHYGFGHSLDGTDFSQVDYNKWKAERKGARYLCVWGCGNNKRYGCKDKTPRPQRKLVPPLEYLKSQEIMTHPRGYAPMISGTINWPRKAGMTTLLKPAADNHPGDSKGWKVMVILPYKYVNGLEILNTNKKLIAKAPYYDTYNEGGKLKGYRYYTGYYCSELTRMAKASSGSEYILVSVVRNVVNSKTKRVTKVRDIYKASHSCYRREG